MTDFELSNPDGLKDLSDNGYSHLAVVPGGKRLAFIAGQGGASTGGDRSPDFQTQARRALENLRVGAKAAGGDLGAIAKITVLIVDHDIEKLWTFIAEVERAFGDGMKPTSTLIPVPRLAGDDMLIEIDAVAVLPN